MPPDQTVFVLGSGAMGFALAAHLADAGRPVVAVRTSRRDVPRSTVTVTVHAGDRDLKTQIDTVSLAALPELHGLLVVAAKAYANKALAAELKSKKTSGPLLIMQNGIGVERPFIEAGFSPICRCLLYATSETVSEYEFRFRMAASSPVGKVVGGANPDACVQALSTLGFPFHAEPDMQRQIWKKAILNSAWNSICPLLEVDNGVFTRDQDVLAIGRQIIRECLTLTRRLDLDFSEDDLVQQLRLLSSRVDGQFISTLQDIRMGRPTEIESLNLEIARVAASLTPALDLPRTELLGKMILAKSHLHPGGTM